MKKQLLFFCVSFLLILSSFRLYAQVNEGWTEIGNAAYNSQLYDIAFPTATNGFAVGSGGSVLKTTDGGQNWTAIDIGVNYSLFQIQFTSDTVGYIFGGVKIGPRMTKVLKTTDGGQNWTEVYSYTGDYLSDMFFLNDSLGWLSGYNKIISTSDGGVNWTVVNQSGAYTIKKVLFTNPSRGLYLDNAMKLNKSTDGGQTWSILHDFSPLNGHTMDFADPENGFLLVTTNQSLFLTSDSGATWIAKNSPGERCEVIRAISDSIVFLLNTDENKIFQTTDAGTSFQTVYSNNSAGLKNFKYFHGKYYAVGAGALILSSVDGFVWDTIHHGNYSGQLTDITFIDDMQGVAVGTKGYIKKTNNGGLSWQIESIHPYKDLMGVSYFNSNNIIIAASDSLILQSSDSCQTWNNSSTGFHSQNATGVIMTSPTTGFAYGNLGIYKTADGGASWTKSGTYGNVYSSSAIHADTVFFGMTSFFGYTMDGGVSYVTPISTSQIQNALYFFNANEGVRANHWGQIYTTNNRGVNWSQRISLSNEMFDLCFIDDTTGYCVGDNGYIYKTIDRGLNWFEIESPTMRALHAIWFTPDGTGYIVGDDGMILRKSIVPTYDVDFIVINDEGDSLHNATMEFNASVYPQGNYSVNALQSGCYPYTFSCVGHEDFSDTLLLSSDSSIVVEMKKYHQLTVNVHNVFSTPVENADVTVGLMNDQTDALGTVVFQDLTKANAIQLQIQATHYLSQTHSIDILGDTLFAILLKADINAPIANAASSITNNSFTANWGMVTAADSFALFVSTDSFITHLAAYDSLIVNATSQIVSGLNPNQQYYYRLRAINDYGFSDYSNTIQLTTTNTSIEESASTAILSLWPNPANDFINISIAEEIDGSMLWVRDCFGRIIIERKAENTMLLDISNLPSGIYLVQYYNQTMYFVKQ